MDGAVTLWGVLACGRGEPWMASEWHGERFTPLSRRDRCEWLIRRPGARVGLAPRTGQDRAFVSVTGCLWAHAETGKEVEALARFHVKPTLVLRHPSRLERTAVWALVEPLPFEWALRANRRLAHRLGCKKLHACPESFMAPAGDLGLAEVEAVTYTARQVVGGLRDAPDAVRPWERSAA